jgi:hypothetical protein
MLRYSIKGVKFVPFFVVVKVILWLPWRSRCHGNIVL